MITPHRHNAFALVLVLTTIVLAATITVFFLSSVGRERRGVDLYAQSNHVRHLSGMTVNHVIGQVGAATKEGTAQTPVSWASQPGMIRTFGSDGNLKNVYKLYSWDNIQEVGSAFNPSDASQVPPAGWKTSTAHFTDLNKPVNDTYPIVDPRIEGIVQGFSIDKANPAVAGSDSLAPMPVKWLYVLEDGQMVAPSSNSGTTATIPGASAANPIVGRVAFWTDDETSKVNINTASEGAYWDQPKSGSRDELQFAGNPPVKGEFQRIAGHPAMTSLSAVFPELINNPTRWSNVSSFRTEMEAITSLTPRIRWGGSQGGTYPVDSWSMDYAPAFSYITSGGHTPPSPITLGTSRLYAISDDFWFQPGRAANAALSAHLTPQDFRKRLFFLTAVSRAPETTLFETPRISLWPITWPNPSSYYTKRRTLSGITAPSVLNASTTAIKDNPWTTPEERLLAFCSTLNTSAGTSKELRYFFQRQNPDSPTYDWTSSALSRNQELVKYLRSSLSKNIPGFGGSLASKWGAENADSIALNSFDYSRSMVNQFTAPTLSKGVQYSYAGVGSRYGRFEGVTADTGSAYTEPNAKTVIPLTVALGGNSYTTQGAFPALSGVSIIFYATDRLLPQGPTNPSGSSPGAAGYKEPSNPYNWKNLINTGATGAGAAVGYDNGTPGVPEDDIGSRTTAMRAVMLLDFARLIQGTEYFAPVFWVKVRGGPFTVNGSAINLPSSSGRIVQCAFDSSLALPKNFFPLFQRGTDQLPKTFTNSAVPGSEMTKTWSLVSDSIAMSPNQTAFSFGGSSIIVEIYACDPNDVNADPTNDSSRLVTSKTIDFSSWNGALPIPLAPRWGMASKYYVGGQFPDTPAQPNPFYRGYPAFSGLNFTPARTLPLKYAPETNDTRWALGEYVPTIATAMPSLPDPRLTNSSFALSLTRPSGGVVPYLFQSAVQLNCPADLKDDERFQPGDRVSTNFRKRLLAINQRAGLATNRPEFYLEGYEEKPANAIEARGADAFTYFRQNMEAIALITPYDTVISMVPDSTSNSGGNGDPRLAVGAPFKRIDQILPGSPANVIPTASLNPSNLTAPFFPLHTIGKQFHRLASSGNPIPLSTGYRSISSFSGNMLAISGADPSGAASPGNLGNNPTDLGTASNSATARDAMGLIGAEIGLDNKVPAGADWTSGAGQQSDGGFLSRPNQEYQQLAQDASHTAICQTPFFAKYGAYLKNSTSTSGELSYFSPNSQIPSPVILGTIPSSTTTGWTTLAFSPNPAAGPSHPGLATPPDHLYLDNFWMPVAEPYPISDQFSTAGKVNLNYAMAPFSYIKRQTGLYAVLKSVWIHALPESVSKDYKSPYWMRSFHSSVRTRYPIDIGNTLAQFDDKFSSGDIFRSATQICEMFLYPSDPTTGTPILSYNKSGTNIKSWWDTQKLTTDNGREVPYDAIYSRVTTKSNTYTVHWQVQALRKPAGNNPGTWNDKTDRVAAELRGSTVIERYIDPNISDIPDHATEAEAEPLSKYYKWRTVSENYFQP